METKITTMETDTRMETDTMIETTETKEINPPPKPQRVKKLPKIKGVELVDVSVEALPNSQDQWDRDQRAIKALRITRRQREAQ